jgi:hypothetical protein
MVPKKIVACFLKCLHIPLLLVSSEGKIAALEAESKEKSERYSSPVCPCGG